MPLMSCELLFLSSEMVTCCLSLVATLNPSQNSYHAIASLSVQNNNISKELLKTIQNVSQFLMEP